MVYDLQEGSIPRFYSLRRISRECSSILPLEVMKRYQCVVVGLTGRTLTLAIIHPRYLFLCKVISKLTGYTVFPVYVEPIRVRLLLQRIERAEQRRLAIRALAFHHYAYVLHAKSITLLLSYQLRYFLD
jgi:hypothetical protein